MTLTRRRACRYRIVGPRALNHDRALRTLFACDYPRRRARIGSAPLLHFGQNLIERQPHQRGRNFGLLLLIVGDADGGKNGLIERRRIAPYAPRSILGNPIMTHGAPLLIRDT